MTTKTLKMCFVIHGDFLTDHVREAWCDGDGERALRILGDLHGLPEEAKHAILEGRQKLAGTSKPPGLYLKADTATTDKRGRKLMTMVEYLAGEKAKLKKAEERADDHIIAKSRDTVTLGSPWGQIKVPRMLTKVGGDGLNQLSLDSWDEFEERFPQIVAKTMDKRRAEWDNSDFSCGAGLIAAMDPRLQAAAQAVLNPPKVCPAPDKDLVTMNGWINPEGKLYPCGFMGHDNLAHLLDKTVAILEKSWVKLQDVKDPRAIVARVGDDFPHIPDRGVTQAQLNTMNRWCTKHGRSMPTNIEVR